MHPTHAFACVYQKFKRHWRWSNDTGGGNPNDTGVVVSTRFDVTSRNPNDTGGGKGLYAQVLTEHRKLPLVLNLISIDMEGAPRERKDSVFSNGPGSSSSCVPGLNPKARREKHGVCLQRALRVCVGKRKGKKKESLFFSFFSREFPLDTYVLLLLTPFPVTSTTGKLTVAAYNVLSAPPWEPFAERYFSSIIFWAALSSFFSFFFSFFGSMQCAP